LSVNHPPNEGAVRGDAALDRLEMVMRYHEETKHHFSRYARALGHMDWANQPNPFRRYEGSPVSALPLLEPDDPPLSPLYEDLYRDDATVSAPVSVRSLSRPVHPVMGFNDVSFQSLYHLHDRGPYRGPSFDHPAALWP
jgi:hypothetical protein